MLVGQLLNNGMAWKEMTVEELAKSLDVDIHEVREKLLCIPKSHKTLSVGCKY